MLTISTSAQEIVRPQEPTEPYPYKVEEVTFKNAGAEVTLHGTLTMPAKGRKFPAVVLLTGSGIQNRDEELFGHKPFKLLADYFTRRGMAVLRYDDRGYGESPDTVAEATTADFAADAVAGMEFLRGRKEIDRQRIGLVGHSEGAEIAFMAATAQPAKVAFVVSMAGPGLNGTEISVMQIENILRQRGIPDHAVKQMGEKQRHDLALLTDNTPEFVKINLDSIARVMVPGFAFQSEEIKNTVRTQILASNGAWARFFMTYDPVEDISRVKVPVLAINGSRDIQVASDANLDVIEAALEKGGNTNYEVIEYEGLNHLFQKAETGSLDEYATLEETFSERVMGDIAKWILEDSVPIDTGRGEMRKISTRVEVISDTIVVYTTQRQEYMGGAHGMETTEYANYDLKTGKRLTLNDLFTAEEKTALAEKIRAQILEQNGVSTWDELIEKTCYLTQGEVLPTENFKLSESTITFRYNPYDIACYAQDGTEVEVALN